MTLIAYKRPESVLVLVYTEAGEVLLLRRRQPDDFWQSVTGSLEEGETPEQAARRELFEETGIAAGQALIDCQVSNRFPILPAWRARYAPEVSHNIEYVFRCRFPQRPDIQIDPAEHTEFQWLECASAADLASSYTNREALLGWLPAPLAVVPVEK